MRSQHRVDDFDATLVDMEARGVPILDVVDDSEDGYRLARLTDLEGNELNIYTTEPRRTASPTGRRVERDAPRPRPGAVPSLRE